MATDVWGLGSVLLEALTGFPSDEPPEGRAAMVLRWRARLPTARTYRRVLAVIEGCMRDEPRQRFTLAEVHHHLGELVELREP